MSKVRIEGSGKKQNGTAGNQNGGNMDLRVSSDSVREAMAVLRHELLKHGLLYDAFRASVLSAVIDSNKEQFVCKPDDSHKVADKIMQRITGEE